MKIPTVDNRYALIGVTVAGAILYCIIDRVMDSSDKALDKDKDVRVKMTDEGIDFSALNVAENNALEETADTLASMTSEDTKT